MASAPPPYGPGGYPTPGAGYPPGGYPPGGYPPGGYPPGGYAPAPAPYQPPQPVVVAPSGQQDQQQQSSVVVVGGGQNTIQGNCPACKIGFVREEYSRFGICLAISTCGVGAICCLLCLRERRCFLCRMKF